MSSNGKITMDGKPLFGEEWRELRAEIKRLGGVWNGKEASWTVTPEILSAVCDRLPKELIPQSPAPPAPPQTQPAQPPPPQLVLPAASAPPTPQEPAQPPQAATSNTRRVLEIPQCICIIGKVRTVGAVENRRLDEQVGVEELERGSKTIKRKETIRTTKRIVTDVEERDRAEALANQIRYRVRQFGYHPDLGPVCPMEKKGEMAETLQEVDRMVSEWNRSSRYHHLVVTYEMVTMDSAPERAARTITFDFMEVLNKIKAALDSADVEAIRSQATFMAARITGMESILPEREQGLLRQAVENARSAADYMKREIEKKGRLVAEVLEEVSLEPLELARMSFLQYSMPEGLDRVGGGGVEEQRFANMGAGVDELDLESSAPAVDAGRFSGLEIA